MLNLTNAQASAFNSPIISRLFQDTSRQFPIEDVFLLSAAVQEIQGKLSTYQKAAKDILDKYEGAISPEGMAVYPDQEKTVSANAEFERLNKVEMEYAINPIAVKPGWPNLTLAEATILQPILKVSHGEEKKEE